MFPKKVVLPPRFDGWYGRTAYPITELTKNDQPIYPFKVSIPDSELVDLKQRLDRFRQCESFERTNFEYGMNSQTLNLVVDYWKKDFNWKKCERLLNEYQHFKVKLEGIDVHYVHVQPENCTKPVIPIMMLHGWPGSFFEFYKTFPLLMKAGEESGVCFEVIAPSIPGYGFSEAPHQPGFNVVSAARILVKLMKRIGFERFIVYGGDWGSVVSQTMAVLYPENLYGIHTSFLGNPMPHGLHILKYLAATYVPSLFFREDINQRKMFEQLVKLKKLWFFESGYYQIHSTKPDSLGFALNDSPVGLAAYILEKFSTWTDIRNINKPDGGLTNKFTMDELLTNVLIYWFSQNITPSMRFYKENLCPKNGILRKFNLNDVQVQIPAAYSMFPNEMSTMPRFIVEKSYANLIQYTVKPSGGHFAAFEEPQLITDDLVEFTKKLQKIHKIS